MAELIERYKGRVRTFLDVGTGTGLLSIIAAKCGAECLDVLDIDQLSTDMAKKNSERNNVKFDMIHCGDFDKFPGRKHYDFVAANLITHELTRLQKKIVSRVRPGGWLAVSGVSLEHLEMLKKSFRVLPLRCIKIVKGKKWAALLFRRNIKK